MDNRNQILKCALDLFAARGYAAVGVQEISETAGVTKPTLYHYFGSKQGLLAAVFEHYHTPFARSIQQASEYHGDLPLTLDRIAQAYFNFAMREPVYYRLLLGFVFSPREGDDCKMAEEVNARQFTAIEQVFIQAVHEHGNLRGRHRLYAATFIGLLNTCISLWLNGHSQLDETLRQRVLHQFQHGIYS
ncbi:MAG TPA: TetR/AcrR family transcriptional regulator [Anaerolineaceae bacterium]